MRPASAVLASNSANECLISFIVSIHALSVVQAKVATLYYLNSLLLSK